MRVIKKTVPIHITSGTDEFNSAEVIVDEEEFYIDTVTGQTVYIDEYEAFSLFDIVEQELNKEKTLGKDARYIVIARRYLPALRKIFWKYNQPLKDCIHNKEVFDQQIKQSKGQEMPQSFNNEYGINNDELSLFKGIIDRCQELIRELSLQQTEPLAAIDSNPNLDSYTGQLLPYGADEEVKDLEFPLEGHEDLAPDVETEIEFPISDEIVETTYMSLMLAYDILTRWARNKNAVGGDLKRTLLYDATKLVNESYDLQPDMMAYKEIKDDTAVVKKLSVNNPITVYPKLPKDLLVLSIKEAYTNMRDNKKVFYRVTPDKVEKGEFTNNTLEGDALRAFSLKLELMAKQSMNAIRHMLDFNDDDVEQMYVDPDNIPSVPLTQNETMELNVSLEEVFEIKHFLNRKIKKFKKETRQHFDLCRAAGMTELEAEEATLLAVPNFPSTTKLIDALNGYTAENQDKVFFVLEFGWLDGMLDKIHCPGYGSMEDYCDIWADRILEQIWDAKGNNTEPSDQEIWNKTAGWDKEYALRLPEKHWIPRNTRAYFCGVMSVMGTESDLDAAGMAAWRKEISYPAARAYDYALAHYKTDGPKEAWAAFYHTAKVVDANHDKVTVETVLPDGRTGQVTRSVIDWPLFFYRAKRLEVYVPKDCPKLAKDYVSQQIRTRRLQELIPTLKETW